MIDQEEDKNNDRDHTYDRSISDVYGMKVYTEFGEYFGVIEDAMIIRNRITDWWIVSAKDSYLSKVLGNEKGRGVFVPIGLVRSFGEIMVIKRARVQ